MSCAARRSDASACKEEKSCVSMATCIGPRMGRNVTMRYPTGSFRLPQSDRAQQAEIEAGWVEIEVRDTARQADSLRAALRCDCEGGEL